MKRFFVLAVMFVPVVAQPKPAAANAKPAAKATTKKAPAAPAASVLPEGAVEVSPNTFTYTDKEGKKWIYRRMPWGYSKAPAAAEAAPSAAMPATQVTDQGDSVKFVRPGPFGNYTWVKSKTDLDEGEKGIFEAWQKKVEQAKAAPDAKKEQ